jgi:phage terminase large subunit-like protein
MDGKALLEQLRSLPPEEREKLLDAAGADAMRFDEDWEAWVHDGQLPPNDDWLVWVIQGGRTFGKTRAGAEWISARARHNPDARIALVAANPDEARKVMVEGRSGLLAVARYGERGKMKWEPGLRRLTFASGAIAFTYSGADGEDLRGPENHFAWCDELAKWRQAEAAWNNLMFTLRAGDKPQVVVTTTPRAVPAMRSVLATPGCVVTRGTAWDNPHTARAAVLAMERMHAGTRLERQELLGELVEEVEGALFPRELLDKWRVAPFPREGAPLRRIVIGVDPPASAAGDECGIVACGIDPEGIAYVLGDHSAGGLSPEQWARRVAMAAQAWDAQRVVAEGNQGGAMVEAVLRGAGLRLPVRRLHARVGKAARAEPIAAFLERGEVRLAGRFPELEAQLAGLVLGGDYQGPGRSPDRADAMIWALTELLLKAPPEPRIRIL